MKRKLIIISSLLVFLLIGGVALAQNITTSRIKEGLSLGNKYLSDGKYEEAILAFQKVIKIQSKNIEARVGMAKAYVKLGRTEEATKILKEAISINPKKVGPYLELSQIYFDLGNFKDSADILCTGYKYTEQSIFEDQLVMMAKGLFDKEKYTEAIIMLNKGIEMNRNNVKASLLLSKVFQAQEKYNEAEKVLKEILSIDMKFVDAYLELGNLYAKLDRLDDAIIILQQGYKETSNIQIKELLDELLKERSNGGVISDKTGNEIMDEYRVAKTYHFKGTYKTVGEDEKYNGKGEMETWISDKKLRTDFYENGKIDRTLLVINGKSLFFYYKDKRKAIAVVDSDYYFSSYIIPSNITSLGKDEKDKALTYNIELNKEYDITGASNKYFVKNRIYCISRKGLIYTKTYAGADKWKIRESTQVFTSIEYNKEFDSELFKDPF